MSNSFRPLRALLHFAQADCADCDARCYVLSIIGTRDKLASGERYLFLVVGNLRLVSRQFRDLLPYLVVDFRLVLAQEARVVFSASFYRDVDRGRYSGSC